MRARIGRLDDKWTLSVRTGVRSMAPAFEGVAWSVRVATKLGTVLAGARAVEEVRRRGR